MVTLLGYVLMISGYIMLNKGDYVLSLVFFGVALPIFVHLFWKQIKRWMKNR
jgi:hypothetical protein